MADNTEYEQDEVVIVPPQNGGNDGDVSGDGGSGTGGSGGTGGSNGDGGDGGDGGGDDGGNDDGSGGGDNEGGDGSGGSGSGGSGSGGSGSGGDGGDTEGGDTDGGDREGDDKEGDDKDGDGEDGDGEDGEGEDKEGDDDSKKDPLIGKEVMLVYVSKAGEMWTVERKIESHNVTTDEYETNKDLFEERDVKVGDVLTFYSLKKGDEETQLHRMDFVLMGDSVAYYDNNSTMQIEEVERINKTEGTLNLYFKTLAIRASDVIKSIPKNNEEEDEDENELPFKVGDRFIIIDKAHETYEVVSINEETESFNYTNKYKGDFTWNLSEAVENFRTGFCKLLEKPSDPIGKKAIILFGSDIGDEIEVYGIGEEHELQAEEYAKDKKRWDKLNLAVGDKWYYYTVRSGGVTGTMARFQFAIKGDYVLHKDTQYLFVYDKFEKGEKRSGKTEWDAVVGHTVQDDTKTERKISVDKFSRVIPTTKKEKKQDENPDEEFESIVMEIINQLKAEFELASAFPSDLREFCRAHFPKSIYDSIKVLKSTNGENAEELGQRGYDMETIREFDSEVAKMMLSYIQTNGYYFSPQTAFNHLLYDAFNKLGVFTFTNTKLNDQNDSTYFVSISNDDGHLTVYSIVPNTFVQKIVFGSTKNIVKFGLWQDRNVTSKKAEDKTKDDYADIDHLYSFLNWVIGIQRKQLEGARVVEHEEINHEIASIYIKQLKALKDATK